MAALSGRPLATTGVAARGMNRHEALRGDVCATIGCC
jgi:hypothetical protein